MKDHYETALVEAVEWHEDAYLFWAEARVQDDKVSVFYRFGCRTASNDVLLVDVEVDGQDRVKSIYPHAIEGTPLREPAIPLEDTILDSADALDLALANGARSYIGQHPRSRLLLVQLVGLSGAAAAELGLEPMIPVWSVGISDLPISSVSYYFDPGTGEFLGRVLYE